jgi:RNA polymerase sigma-70 factor (ECF subfamily)
MVARVDPLSRLACQARRGDGGALEALVETGYEPVWRLCAALVDEQAASDLAQETFMRAVGAISRFQGESSALTWLLGTARHVCLDELRARARRRRRDLAMAARRPGPAHDAGSGVAVSDLVGRLGPDRRAAFVLTQILGLSYAEAAAVCECPPGTIRSRVARARADLIDWWGEGDRGRSTPGAEAAGH